MEPAVLIAIIGLIQALGVAVIGGLFSRSNKRNEDYRKRREDRDNALYGLVLADSEGTEVLLHNAHGDNMNGNVDAALSGIKAAREKFTQVCTEAAVKL